MLTDRIHAGSSAFITVILETQRLIIVFSLWPGPGVQMPSPFAIITLICLYHRYG